MKKSLLFWIIAMVSMVLSSAQEGDTFWTPGFSMGFSVPTGTSISPEGKYIAYTVRVAKTDKSESSYLTHIWIASSDGSWNRQYTRGEKSCLAPAFSPDGKSIAFMSERDGSNQLYLIGLMGGEAEKISDVSGELLNFKWSPEGNKLVLLVKEGDTEEEKKSKEEKEDIIFVDKNYKNSHLFILKREENGTSWNEKQLTSGSFSVNGFDWSPDGKNIAFSFQPDPSLNTGFIHSDISIIPADSGKTEVLVSRPGLDKNPVYSPDGNFIAFESHGGQPEAVGLSDIWLADTRGGKVKMLSESPDRQASIIGWSVDGKFLYITEEIGTSGHLLSIPVKGSDIAVLSMGNYVIRKGDKGTLAGSRGTWSGFSIASKVQAMAFIYQESDKPPQVFYSNIFPYRAEQISQLNHEKELPPIAKTELIRWLSVDNMEIEGLLTYPLNYEKGKKYPVILNIHGGPGGVFTQQFTGAASIYLLQYFAEKGFFVLRPNPRGSAGYGKDFRYSNVKDWGFGDLQDLVTGLDTLINRGLADEKQQYVMGWSYGGYMTGYIVTRTDRFRAASMGAGLPDLVSMVTTTDIPEYLVAHMGGKELWEDYEIYEKHSAIYQVERVKTPTQIIHGEQDFRVPITQGKELYVALKRLGVPSEMIILPRTPHSPREPKLQMAVSPLILDWFLKYK